MQRALLTRALRDLLVASAFCAIFSIACAQSAAVRAELPQLKVGDRWRWEQNDRRTGLKTQETDRTITSISSERIEGTESGSKLLLTADLMLLESSTVLSSSPARVIDYPLELGKKWEYKLSFTNKANTARVRWQAEAEVVAYEKVKVPAGEFDAFKIAIKGFWNNDTSRRNGRLIQTSWYAPAAKVVVKSEFDDTVNNNVNQLIEFKVQP
jgi:hypothetical protein